MTNEYRAAYEAHNTARQAFSVAQASYRAMKIGDAEYLSARKVFDDATKIFDAAFASEADREEGSEEIQDSQLQLF